MTNPRFIVVICVALVQLFVVLLLVRALIAVVARLVSRRAAVATSAHPAHARRARLLAAYPVQPGIAALLHASAQRAADWQPLRVTPGRVAFAAWSDEAFAAFCAEEARGAARRVERIEPAYPRMQFELALLALARDDWPTASGCLDRALALEPDHPLLWTAYGLLRELSGSPAEALQCYVHGRAQRPWCARDSELARTFADALSAATPLVGGAPFRTS